MIPIIALVLAIFIDRGFANHFFELKKGQDFVTNGRRTISEHTVIDLYERMGIESIDIEGSPFKGPKDAAVIITVFSDFECPACLTMGKFLDEFFNKRKNDIKMVYKYFPLDTRCNRTVSRPFHLNACTSAYYSYCAYRQGKFWDMHRLISASSPNFSLDLANSWITSLNLNKEMMDRCVATDAVKFVEKDIEMGIDLNIDATPTIYLNNRNISFVGAREDDLNLIVDYLLKR